MRFSDFRNLDRNNIGGWPQGIKYFLCGFLFVLENRWYSVGSGRSRTSRPPLETKQHGEEALKDRIP